MKSKLKRNKLKMNLQLFAEPEQRKTKEEIEKRLAEIKETLEKGEGNLEELEIEINGLQEERKNLEEIERRQVLASKLNTGDVKPEKRVIEDNDEKEQRGKNLKENRAVVVSSEEIVLPNRSSNTINDTFNEVSSLLDRVTHIPLDGGESFKQPYMKINSGEGGYTKEGAKYIKVKPQFGYAEIRKTKTTAYSETSEELEKLPNADYAGRVSSGVVEATRKHLTKQILIGNGESENIVGIFSDKATAIDPSTDMEISEIGFNTLDEILFSYGGDEDVEDPAVLILNKSDLKKFALLRYPDGRKAYEVKANGNTGTINGTQYIINSACSSLQSGEVGDYIMAYGPLSNYTFATFSPIEVKKSEDFKFDDGIVAHRASVFTGGNVTSHNGFLRVKKAADTGK